MCVPGDRVAVVDDGDGLDEDGGDEVAGAEVGEDDVDGGVEERLPLADGDEDDEVEEDAEEGQRHLHHHHAGALPAGWRHREICANGSMLWGADLIEVSF